VKNALLILSAALVLGLAAWPIVQGASPTARLLALAPVSERIVTVEIPPVEVQLKGQGAPRLVLGLTVECMGEDAAHFQEAAALQRARDELLSLLATLTPEEAGETPSQRFALKRLLAERLPLAAVPTGKLRVHRLHFTKLLFSNAS
jgi:hypothetical protein